MKDHRCREVLLVHTSRRETRSVVVKEPRWVSPFLPQTQNVVCTEGMAAHTSVSAVLVVHRRCLDAALGLTSEGHPRGSVGGGS